MLPPNPACKLAQAISDHLSVFCVTPEAVEAANLAVYQRRVARCKALNAKNFEYVIERLLRPVVRDCAMTHLGIQGDDDLVSRHVYSSHYHTTEDDEKVYQRRWDDFKRENPTVDTYDVLRQGCRADLFISLGDKGDKQLVSIEFKYVPPSGILAAGRCARQVLQHISKHDACVLVAYVAQDPPSGPFDRSWKRTLEELAGDPRVFVVAPIRGPAVELPYRAKPAGSQIAADAPS